MRIGIPKETLSGETRVAATPKTVEQLIQLGYEVCIEQDAGQTAHFDNAAYEQAGAQVVDTTTAWSSGIILKVNPPSLEEVDLLLPHSVLISFIWPASQNELVQRLQE